MLSVGSPFSLATAPRFGTFYVIPTTEASAGNARQVMESTFSAIEKSVLKNPPSEGLEGAIIRRGSKISMLKVDGSPEAEEYFKNLLKRFGDVVTILSFNSETIPDSNLENNPDIVVSRFTYVPPQKKVNNG